MGFSITVSHALWFFAILAVLGGGLDFWFDHQSDLKAAREARRDIDGERLHTRFGDAKFCYDGVNDKVFVFANNTGTTALDLTGFSFVIDGAATRTYTTDVADAGSTETWLPQEQANFTVANQPAEPNDLTLVSPRGVIHYATKFVCPRLATIVVTPASASMNIGDTQTFTATGYDQFGNLFDGAPYTWTSAAGTVTTINGTSAQLLAGTTAGTFEMTATSGTVSGSATVTIHAGAPASLTVTPDPVDVIAGGTQQFTATVRDTYGNQNTTTPVTWTTNAGSITSGGLLTAQTAAQNALQVTATTDTLSDQATVNVVAGPLDHVIVTPSSATLQTEQTQSFSAAGYDRYGNAIGGLTFAWTATRGTIDQNGLYTAPETTGSATVTATADGVSGTATVTITAFVHVEDITTYKAGVATTTFTRSDTVESRVLVRDQAANLQAGVTVTVGLYRPNGNLYASGTGVTGADGIAIVNLTLSSPPGQWTVRVTDLSGTGFTYDSAANVESQVTISVT